MQQTIDSLRDYLLDSLEHRYSVIESKQSDNEVSEVSEYNFTVIPASFIVQQPKLQTRRRRTYRDSLRRVLDKDIRSLERGLFDSATRRALADTSIPPVLKQGVVRTLSKRESIRQLVHSGKTAVLKKRTPSRDSLRAALKNKPKERHAEVIGKKKKEPVSFFIPRELGPFLPPLIPWILLFVISSAVGGIRRVYDTKVYTTMFADLSSNVVAEQLEHGEDLSKIAGRSSLAWQNIEFFQYNLPEFLEQSINVIGAIGALAIFDWRLALVGGSIVLLITVASRFYMRRVAVIQAKLNDMHEQEYNTFATRNPSTIRTYYTEISKLEVSFSNNQAKGFGILRVLMLVMFMATLFISLDLDRFTIGELYSIVAYLWVFVTASEYIPYLSEKWVALKDVTGRLGTEEEVEEAEEE